MSNRHYAVVAVTLTVLGGASLGWRIWSKSPPVPEPTAQATAQATTTGNPTNQTPPVAATPALVAHPTQPAPAPACADCGELPADPLLAEAARRSDFYQDYADQLHTETADELARRWPEVVAHNDPDELPAFLSVFAQSLRESGDAALYQELVDMLHDPPCNGASEVGRADPIGAHGLAPSHAGLDRLPVE